MLPVLLVLCCAGPRLPDAGMREAEPNCRDGGAGNDGRANGVVTNRFNEWDDRQVLSLARTRLRCSFFISAVRAQHRPESVPRVGSYSGTGCDLQVPQWVRELQLKYLEICGLRRDPEFANRPGPGASGMDGSPCIGQNISDRASSIDRASGLLFLAQALHSCHLNCNWMNAWIAKTTLESVHSNASVPPSGTHQFSLASQLSRRSS